MRGATALAAAAARILQANGTLVGEAAAEDPCAASAPQATTIRIASIFILFACSAAGMLPALMGRICSGTAGRAIALCKTVGTGVVLSCALIHMLLPGVQSLTSECVSAAVREDYPALAYLIAL